MVLLLDMFTQIFMCVSIWDNERKTILQEKFRNGQGNDTKIHLFEKVLLRKPLKSHLFYISSDKKIITFLTVTCKCTSTLSSRAQDMDKRL